MESKKDEESLEMDILNENIISKRKDKGFAEETSVDEQENENSQEAEQAFLTTADQRILTIEEGLKILSKMTTRSSEEHRSLVEEHSKLMSMLYARVVVNAEEIEQL